MQLWTQLPLSIHGHEEGNCACGKDKLVKAKVTKVEKDVAYVQAQGWEKPQAFPMQGKYICACGPSCNCGSMSQTPANASAAMT